MRKILSFIPLAIILIPCLAFAQNLSGAYILSEQGVTLTLLLKQDPQGNIAGVLSSSAGAQYQVEGMFQDGVGFGACYNSKGGSYFQAALEGNRLLFALMEPDANNMPDYNKVKQLVFDRKGGSTEGHPGLSGKPGLPPGQPPFGAAPKSPQVNGSAGSAKLSSQLVGDSSWGFGFRPPKGWKYRKTDGGAVLGHDTVAGMILVIPHMAASIQEIQDQMQEGLVEEGLQRQLAGRLQSMGKNALAGDYSGTAQGEQVKARGIGTLSPYGGGAYIIAMTTPAKFGREISAAADAIAGGMEYVKAEASDLVNHFSGAWANMTKSTATYVTLRPDGTYVQKYEGGYSGQFSNQYGSQTGSWGHAREERGGGRWTVRGNRQQGVIVLKSQDGGETVVQYRVHVEKGETYWREYFFNGELYGKQ